jgi:hypothetical protein
MPDVKTIQAADENGDFELGMMLGTRKAFASVAGRCSAADAECLRRLREKRLYLSRAETWEEFCPKFLGLSKTHANRIIRSLEEFGPDYFEVAQLTRITPEQYRTIAPAIREKNIHVNGQAIALLPENSDRVTAAVAELRQAASTRDAAAIDPGADGSARTALRSIDRGLRGVCRDFLVARGKESTGRRVVAHHLDARTPASAPAIVKSATILVGHAVPPA